MKYNFYLFIAFTLASLCYAEFGFGQDTAAIRNVTHIGDLVQTDWSHATMKDSILFEDLMRKTHDGQARLRAAISKNPKSYPLHQLENPDHFETDEHRRWEYQMKRFPVHVISIKDIENVLHVSLVSTQDTIRFCNDAKVKMELSIQNISGRQLPSFLLELDMIPGLNVSGQQVSLKDSSMTNVQNSGRKGARYHVQKFEKNETILIEIEYNVDCNGKGSSPSLMGAPEAIVNPTYIVEFIGYQLDFNQQELYKVVNKKTLNSRLVLRHSLD